MIVSILIYGALCTTSSVPCSSQFSSTSAYDFTIVGCVFSYLTSSSNGGAVNIDSSSSSTVVINLTLFSHLYSTASGGGFYFNVVTTSLYLVCGTDCTAASTTWLLGGQLFYSKASSSQAIQYLSVALCSNSTLKGTYASFLISSGSGSCSLSNSSYNSLSDQGSCILFSANTNPVACYMTFYNCSSSTYRLFVYDYPTNGFMNQSNIISNSQTLSSEGIVFAYSLSSGNFYVCNCVFCNNSGPLFNKDSTINFYVYNCWIAHSGSVSAGNIATSACSLASTSSLQFSEIKTKFGSYVCGKDSDSTTLYTSSLNSHKLIVAAMILTVTLSL